MFGLLAVGTTLFWAFCIVPFLLLCYLVENEKHVGAAITTIVTAILALMLLDRSAFTWLLDNYLVVIVGYIAAGILWGGGRWIFYVWRYLDAYRTVRASFLKQTSAETVTKENKKDFQKALAAESYSLLGQRYDLTLEKPRALDNKARIIFWMTYWPASMVWTFLNDPVQRLFRFIFRRLVGVFDGISDFMFRKYASDFED